MKKTRLVLVTAILACVMGATGVAAFAPPPPPPTAVISPAISLRPQVRALLEDANTLLEQAEEAELEIPEELYDSLEEAETTGNAVYAKNLLNDLISELEALLG